MSAEELKSKIQFKETTVGSRTLITGQLTVQATIEYANQQINNRELDDIKELLRLKILWHLYEDQRQALYDAVRSLLSADPMDYDALAKASEQILKAAQYQENAKH